MLRAARRASPARSPQRRQRSRHGRLRRPHGRCRRSPGGRISGAITLPPRGRSSAKRRRSPSRRLATNLDPGEATLARLLAGETRDRGDGQPRKPRVAWRSRTSPSTASRSMRPATWRSPPTPSTARSTVQSPTCRCSPTPRAARRHSPQEFRAHRRGPTSTRRSRSPAGRLLDQPVENAVVQLQGRAVRQRLGGGADARRARSPAGRSPARQGPASTGRAASSRSRRSILRSATTGSRARSNARRRGRCPARLRSMRPNLRTLAALALIERAGSGAGRGALRARRRTPDARGGLQRQRLFPTRRSRRGPSQATCSIDDAFGAPLVRGNATALGRDGRHAVRSTAARATASVAGGATRFEAAAQGPDLNLCRQRQPRRRAGAQVVRIDTLTGTAFRLPVQLNQPVTISLDGSQSRIGGATLALGGGTVRIDGAVSPRLDLTVVAERRRGVGRQQLRAAASARRGRSPAAPR